MKIESLSDECTGCFACYNICPVDAIRMEENEEGFYFPSIDRNKCIGCLKCDKNCPVLSLPVLSRAYKAFYGWNKDEIQRKNSSSGGIYALLANLVLAKKGVVYGAVFNYTRIRLECRSTEDTDLKSLQKSKYVQSYIGFAYRKIGQDLQAGRDVLFCGTPCQVSALNKFLGKSYPNLLTCDFVCHGVPSISLLKKHVESLSIKDIKSINFRPKLTAWVDYLIINYGNNKVYKRYWKFDSYFLGFQKYINLRRSCYNCHYSKGVRAADITLADFWGISSYNPDLFDKKGLSLILVNTGKGDAVLNALMQNNGIIIKNLDLKYAAYVYQKDRKDKSSGYDLNKRNSFIAAVYQDGYKKAILDYDLYVSYFKILTYEIKNKLKILLSKLWLLK